MNHSPMIAAMGRRLVAEGCGHYEQDPSPSGARHDRRSYAACQHKLGFKGRDADGIPGSWDRLSVPES